MATDLSASFVEQYANINTKLKKRFMRKPNVSEATNEFIALAIQCEHSEQPAFAGQTYIGAAKCEASVGNFLGEAEQYIAAARQFMKAEKKLYALKFYNPDRENLEAAIGCYMQALSKYSEKSPLRTSILMELANELVELNHKLEAVSYYEQALDTVQDKAIKLICLRNLVDLLIECDKHERALQIANSIIDSDICIPMSILEEIQVTRILLGLLVEPTEDSKPESLKKLYENLLDDEDNETMPFTPELKLKLQSIILSSNMADHQPLITVAAQTKHLLTCQQADVLEAIVEAKSEE